MKLTAVEVCAGAGGQALGLEQAGFSHVKLVELDNRACKTLRRNRPEWDVEECDLRHWSTAGFEGVDLLAGGPPCSPFSVAGRQRGFNDQRDLLPRTLTLIEQIKPKAVMLENVRGILAHKFYPYRMQVNDRLRSMGYVARWRLLNAADFGVPQLRARAVMVAALASLPRFRWPESLATRPTVGEAIKDLMAAKGWAGVDSWARQADTIAPTLVGGSKLHGGADLGPAGSRAAWLRIGIDGRGLAEVAPLPDFTGHPRLTVRMAARLQGFPDDWQFAGRKCNAYRQVGNAFPPPVAAAVGARIRAMLAGDD